MMVDHMAVSSAEDLITWQANVIVERDLFGYFMPRCSAMAGFLQDSPCEAVPPKAVTLWPSRIPADIWTMLLSHVADVRSIAVLAPVARGIQDVLRNSSVWAGRPVRLSTVPSPPGKLGPWLPAWEHASRLVVPASPEDLEYIRGLIPDANVEAIWRFDRCRKGDGVEVLRGGRVARRVRGEELVVVGSAPLSVSHGMAPYLEIRIDERNKSDAVQINDFGFGFTECDPSCIQELGSVAAEVPKSWVVDFTQSSVVLNINNKEMARSYSISARDLCEGTRVGMQIMRDAVEVFVDGTLRERLCPHKDRPAPLYSKLFPVFDLYGQTVQISVTDKETALS